MFQMDQRLFQAQTIQIQELRRVCREALTTSSNALIARAQREVELAQAQSANDFLRFELIEARHDHAVSVAARRPVLDGAHHLQVARAPARGIPMLLEEATTEEPSSDDDSNIGWGWSDVDSIETSDPEDEAGNQGGVPPAALVDGKVEPKLEPVDEGYGNSS